VDHTYETCLLKTAITQSANTESRKEFSRIRGSLKYKALSTVWVMRRFMNKRKRTAESNLFKIWTRNSIRAGAINGSSAQMYSVGHLLLLLLFYFHFVKILLSKHVKSSWTSKEGEMGGTCGMHGREEKYIQGFGWKTCSKEAAWKT
jgi:hypothetical protein